MTNDSAAADSGRTYQGFGGRVGRTFDSPANLIPLLREMGRRFE